MGLSEIRDHDTTIVGREAELAILDRVLDAARSGESAALVIRGEPGIGKTTLLDLAARRASDMTVLRASGVPAEADLAFAGLHGLLRPVLDRLEDVPALQAAALRGALGLGPLADAERFTISAAVLSLLAAAADERPVVCLVDDAQWLDAPSADALVFAARRLRVDRVALLFGAREGDPARFDGPGLPELTLGGLEPAAAEALLVHAAETPSAAVRSRLLAEAAGNPLALIELPAALTPAQREGREDFGEAVPLTPRLSAVFRRRIEALPEATRIALVLAAADGTGELAVLVPAAEALGLGPDAFDAAQRDGLIAVGDRQLRFRHPLVRSALYETATISLRRAAHLALAAALPGDDNADRRVWHQALATMSPDAEIADALEISARRSELRAAHASAASALLRAAELTLEPRPRARRALAAAWAAWSAGQAHRARAIIAAELSAATETRAPLLHLSGLIEASAGSLDRACGLFERAAEASDDASLTLESLLEAVEAAAYSGEIARVGELVRRGAGVPAKTSRERTIAAILQGLGRVYAGDHEHARELLASALDTAGTFEDPRMLLFAAIAASLAGNMGDGLQYVNRAVELARGRGLLNLLPFALRAQSGELLRRSRLRPAHAAASEAERLGSELGFAVGWPLMGMASPESLWGEDDAARDHAERAFAIGQTTGELFLCSSAQYTLAFIDLSRGRFDQATTRLLELARPGGTRVHPMTARAVVPDLVEAAVRAGRTAEIAEPLARYVSWVEQSPSPAGRALLARCRALLEPRAETYAEALGLEAELSPFQQGRTKLLYGEWLRRERRRGDARGPLRAAVELFRGLGVAPWEDRAATELRATGETTRKRDPSTRDDLTAQERQIAELVAEGLTNREIAAQLFLSPRTVDYHLRKVFAKLGLASRAELVRHGIGGLSAG